MNKTLKVEIEMECDQSRMEDVLFTLRKRFVNIKETQGVRLVTVREFNKDRGVWLTYGWGNGMNKTQIWNPLEQEELKNEK